MRYLTSRKSTVTPHAILLKAFEAMRNTNESPKLSDKSVTSHYLLL